MAINLDTREGFSILWELFSCINQSLHVVSEGIYNLLSSLDTLSKVETTSCWRVAAAVLLTARVLLACKVAHISNVFARRSPLRSFE